MIARSVRVISIIAAAAMLLVSLAACSALPGAPNEDAILSFREVPGVTDEEIAAIEKLGEEYDTITYGMLNSTETFMRTDGTIGGYSALFCEEISAFFGIRFEPTLYEWNELIEGFESGAIHFTGELTATEERRARYIMSDTFTERTIVAFMHEVNKSLASMAKEGRLTLAYLDGSTTIDSVISSMDYEADYVAVPSELEALSLLISGEVDAFLAEEHSAAVFPNEIHYETVFPVVYSPVSFSTSVKEFEPLVSVFDKYLQSGGHEHLIGMYNSAYHDYLQHKLYSQLTGAEKDYLASHAEGGEAVALIAEYDNYPNSFYNTQEDEWQGIAFDVIDEIVKLTGLNIEVANLPGSNWAEIMVALESGEADMVTELIYSKEREGRFIWTDQPYSVDYYALLSLGDQENVGINQILYSRVGLITDSAYEDIFFEWFPDHKNTYSYRTTDDGFKALTNGDIDLFMGSRNMLLGETNYVGNPSYKENLVFDKTYSSSFAFYKENELLRGIFSKAQRLVDTEAISERWTRKVFDYRSKVSQQQVPFLWGMSIVLICGLMILLVSLLRVREMKNALEQTVKERTAELEVQTAAAEAAARAKGDFLSRMSHEIRTPLNAIIGMAQIAQGADTLKKTKECLSKMGDSSRHLLGIINDILDFSKFESGKMELEYNMFSLRYDVESVVAMFRTRAAEKDIDLRLSIEVEHDGVDTDALRLNQVIINLLSNAIKFTKAGGVVEARVAELGYEDGRATYRFSVSDTGIGISADQAGKLFKPFSQADAGVTRQYGGTGLGLAISESIINLMGSNIELDSVPDKGSTFSFTVSFRAEDSFIPEEQVGALQDLPDLRDRKILIVDDIEINREIALEMLSDTGADIYTAENGLDALGKFTASPEGFYDIILMDMQMPIMDGVEATSKIRQSDRPDAATIKIIAMTANVLKEDVDRAYASGMDGYIAKPIELSELYKCISRFST